MVGLVLVSHSKALGDGLKELVLETAGRSFPVAVAAGAGEDHEALGTDAVFIAKVLGPFPEGDGAVVLLDLGSALLSAEMALELLEADFPNCREKIRLCPAPLVEGAIAAAVESRAGGSLDSVCREALRSLIPKQQQLPAPAPTVESQTPQAPGSSRELVFTIENEHGLHARPAAALVQAASRFSSTLEVSNQTTGRGPVPARSLTSLALLEVRQGDRIRVRASGADADAALREVSRLAAARFGEGNLANSGYFAGRQAAIPLAQLAQPGSGPMRGTPASEGVGTGRLIALGSGLLAPREEQPADPAAEFARLRLAMGRVEKRLCGRTREPGSAGILAAEAGILSDPAVLERARSLAEGRHLGAAQAWVEVTEGLIASYDGLGDPYLRGRAADVRDIARLVLQELAGGLPPAPIRPDPPAILLSRELLPSEAAACDPSGVVGVITSEGSPTAHSAIMLRTLGIPMIVGGPELDPAELEGRNVAMDGGTGEVWIEPGDSVLQHLSQRKAEWLRRRQEAETLANEPCRTLDGQRIQVLANISSLAEAVLAARNGAEGVGVLRTELLFLSRTEAPKEADQEDALRAIFAPFPPDRTLVVRTLDGGADKPLPFLPQPEEHNPYLGVRGIRLLFEHREFFLAHLRAILAAGAGRNLSVMFPMIAEVQEVERARQLLGQAHAELERAARPHAWPVEAGVMIEVPSAALLAEKFAGSVDFLSIGTNDLTQYVLGAERGNAALAGFQDALHPAVLRLVRQVVEAARARDRHVSVCGDAASDPVAAAVFFGLGIRSLSVRPNQVAEIKACFRALRGLDLMALGHKALEARGAAEARALAAEFLKRRC